MGDLDEGSKFRQGKKIVVGSSELNYKRDNMEIAPLYQEQGICTHCG